MKSIRRIVLLGLAIIASSGCMTPSRTTGAVAALGTTPGRTYLDGEQWGLIPYETRIYTKANVDFILDNDFYDKTEINSMIDSHGSGSETNTWPTIHIDFFQSYQSDEPRYFNNDRFFDFEVKATTNNFKSLVYYYLSTATNEVGPYVAYNFCDKGADVMYKNTEFIHRTNWGDMPAGACDGRVWLKKHRLASIYDCVQNPTLAYVTSVDLIVSTNQVRWINGRDVPQDTSWMYENNPDLQWVVTRISPTDMERISQLTHPFYNATPIWNNERKHSDWAIYELDVPRRGIADER